MGNFCCQIRAAKSNIETSIPEGMTQLDQLKDEEEDEEEGEEEEEEAAGRNGGCMTFTPQPVYFELEVEGPRLESLKAVRNFKNSQK